MSTSCMSSAIAVSCGALHLQSLYEKVHRGPQKEGSHMLCAAGYCIVVTLPAAWQPWLHAQAEVMCMRHMSI